MANQINRLEEWEYSESPLESILGAPFIAAVQTNAAMNMTELRFLLDVCFYKEEGVYKPVQIPMLITRAFVEPGNDPNLADATLEILVPLISLLSISPLAIDDINVQYSLEITSHQSVSVVADSFRNSDDHDNASDSLESSVTKKGIKLHGLLSSRERRARKTTQKQVNAHPSDDTALEGANSGSLYIRMNARAMELPEGLTTIIQAYSNSILPQEKSGEADSKNG